MTKVKILSFIVNISCTCLVRSNLSCHIIAKLYILFSESVEASPPGPKMGINVFSHPRLPGSRSPLNRPCLSLKTGLNCKDQNLGSLTPTDHQRASPVSAPACSMRPEFPAPRMGISLVEKSIHSSRDHITDSKSLDNRSSLSNPCIRPDFRTGICSFCRSQSSLKDALNNSGHINTHLFETCSKPSYFSPAGDKSRFLHVHQDKLSNTSLQVLPKTGALERDRRQNNSNFVPEHCRALSDGTADRSCSPLNRTLSNDELQRNTEKSNRSKDILETPSHSMESVHESSAPSELAPIYSKFASAATCLDRSSPRLIGETVRVN